jgi:hypothetical protein
MEWNKLTVAVGDVGQAPKVEDLAQSEGVGHDEGRPPCREVYTTI